ncbi:MAG: hypothetical protein GOVbin703_41 [Prokaryotic dsDNA virus sp.]|nr:MAG: hypothetical protein GOVbin703_41 [Prokaryotic dsDNA virus sp.]|tara:strand:- start:597 stop:887 length:291 start_codon:yes stop_codon:yes gene_type:complete
MKNDNPLLDSIVEKNESDLKLWLVNYVGEKENPDNGDVTVHHIVNVMANEFPEFLMAVAEENWIRGYEQALNDVEMGEKLANEQKEYNQVDTEISE